eukprot:1161837-Pelagomonas_calceolata.AAC.9
MRWGIGESGTTPRCTSHSSCLRDLGSWDPSEASPDSRASSQTGMRCSSLEQRWVGQGGCHGAALSTSLLQGMQLVGLPFSGGSAPVHTPNASLTFTCWLIGTSCDWACACESDSHMRAKFAVRQPTERLSRQCFCHSEAHDVS